MKVPRKHKFGAQKTVVDGIVFASKAEARRYSELALLERKGLISGLELQPRYDFEVNGVRVGFYKADFRYWDKATNKAVVEDVKGYRTDVFAIKAKLMRALYRVEVIEIGGRRR